MNSLLYPPDYKGLSAGPVVFLAGPIQGAPDWQAEAAQQLLPHAHVANPRAPAWGGHAFERQVDWESHHLLLAARWGVILFWLAKEVTHHPERAYAQTTRFELAEWVTHHRYESSRKVVIGIEDGFSGARYIRHRLRNTASIPILDSLAGTVETAIAIVNEVRNLF